MDLEIAVVAVGLAGEQRLDLTALGLGLRSARSAASASTPTVSVVLRLAPARSARLRRRARARGARPRRSGRRAAGARASPSARDPATFQRLGSSAAAFSSARRVLARSQSKMPPQQAECLPDRIDGALDFSAHGRSHRAGATCRLACGHIVVGEGCLHRTGDANAHAKRAKQPFLDFLSASPNYFGMSPRSRSKRMVGPIGEFELERHGRESDSEARSGSNSIDGLRSISRFSSASRPNRSIATYRFRVSISTRSTPSGWRSNSSEPSNAKWDPSSFSAVGKAFVRWSRFFPPWSRKGEASDNPALAVPPRIDAASRPNPRAVAVLDRPDATPEQRLNACASI